MIASADLARLTDAQIVAVTLYGECRSEPIEGIIAVANVIKNRVQADLGGDQKPDWWGEGWRGVCLKPWQFSCWHPEGGEGNHAKVRELVTALLAGPVTDRQYVECAAVATCIMRDWFRDNTKGSDHYHVATMIPRPTWAKGRVPVTQVAKHVFYKLAA